MTLSKNSFVAWVLCVATAVASGQSPSADRPATNPEIAKTQTKRTKFSLEDVANIAQEVTTSTTGVPVIRKLFPESHSRARNSTTTVDMIMLHFSSDLLQNPDRPFDVNRILQIYLDAGVSAHYLIDRSGRIFQLVPEERAAFHAGKGELAWIPERKNNLNEYSIGIEILAVGSQKDMKMFMSAEKYDEFAKAHPEYVGYTPTQYAAVHRLIDDIISRNPAIKRDRRHIVGHDEWAPTRRSDPGELFEWERIGLGKSESAAPDKSKGNE